MKFLLKIKYFIERYIPMTLGNFLIFGFIIYLIVIVGRSVISNHNSNKEIDIERQKLELLSEEIKLLKNQINYYETYSFKEMEAREKLGFKAPGEKVLSMPIDTIEEKIAETEFVEQKIKVPNYRLWWEYFFE